MITTVTAKDTQGEEFEKTIVVRDGTGFHEGQKIISFGWPVEYIVADLLRHYPFQSDMCIDINGMNHKGSSVNISKEQMDKLMEQFLDAEVLPFNK